MRDWLIELADNDTRERKHPLRLLFLERQATPGSGWWQITFGQGGGDSDAVHRLLDPPEPIDIPGIKAAEVRREILAATLQRSGSELELPSAGEDSNFDSKILQLCFRR